MPPEISGRQAVNAALRSRLERTPPGYRYSKGRILLIYTGLMIIILLAALDQTIVATALPHIAASIGGSGNYSWVFSGYLLTQTVTIPMYGKLGDIYGRRRMILTAVAIFLIASILCGAAQTMPELIVARGLQGIGAGGLIPLVHATIADIVPPSDRGRYQGLTASAFGSGSVLGPLAGGLIVDHASWRWIFYMNVPIGGAAFVVAIATMPKLASTRQRAIDYLGAVLLAVGVGSLLVALTWGGAAHPWASGPVLGAFGVSAVAFAWFAAHERNAADPILMFSLLPTTPVSVAVVGILLTALCQIGAVAYVPLFVQGVIGTSAASSGLVLMPFMLGTVVAAIGTGQYVSRTGRYRGATILGPLIFCLGMVLLWRMGLDTSALNAALDMAIAGVGLGMINPIFIVTAQNAVPHSVVGSTTAFIQFSRALGMTFGATLFGLFISHRLPAVAKSGSLGHRLAQDGRIQLTDAIHPAFAFAVFVSLLLILVALFGIKETPLRKSVLDDPADVLSSLERAAVD